MPYLAFHMILRNSLTPSLKSFGVAAPLIQAEYKRNIIK